MGDQPAAFTLSDIDNDGNLDAVITLPNSNRVMLLSGNGDGTFSNPSYVAIPSSPKGVAAADLNQDGIVDLAISLPEDDQVALLFGIGHKRFAAPQAIHVGDTPNSIAIQDANRDGRLDILVTNSGDDTASIILNKYDPTQVYRYTVVAMDPDDDAVEYTLSSGPGGMIFDAQSGEVQWAPTADQVGLQQVTLQASDGRGGIATQQFTIAVEPARSNAQPVFTSQPDKTVAADGTFAYTSRAVDNDSDPIRYRLVDAPAGASIDPISGEVQWDPRGGALKFNESPDSGGVQVPNSASLDVSSFTLEGWFEFASTGNQVLIWKDAPNQYPSNFASYAIHYQWGTLKAIIGDGTGAGEAILNYPWTPNIGQAYHLAATFDSISGSLQLLINGNAVAELTTDKRIANFAMPLYLGFSNFDPFHGTMSQVRIWDTARSAAEIRAGMDRAFTSATPNLMADYRFLEGESQSVVDASGHQLIGKLFGSGWPRRIVGIAPISVASFTLSAEDGRGGFDLQSFDVQIEPVEPKDLPNKSARRGVRVTVTAKQGLPIGRFHQWLS
ncbi:MAG: LamG-like jellyroll fold domain-containing protein, partial [Aureliella sp.]